MMSFHLTMWPSLIPLLLLWDLLAKLEEDLRRPLLLLLLLPPPPPLLLSASFEDLEDLSLRSSASFR